ncbi:amidohydrolase [Edaphobacter aggregans]|uniref:amidohydrolase n=1 Tax=Edaphobacter aggregans TaxID=570835 RepID=UPI000555EDA2|nr:amidohydrolase [Edaphobacter aggregans]
MKAPIAVILLLAAAAHAQSVPQPIPPPLTISTIYINGNILTGAHLRPDDPSPTPARVSAIAIGGSGAITAVGEDSAVLFRKTANTKIIDLHGAFVMPGFIDAHTHIAGAGQQKLTIDLDGTKSLTDMQQRIRDYAAKQQPGAWLQGGGWDQTKWPTKTLPTRQDIDAVTAGHPAVLERTDGHILVANSAALAAAHITRDTPDPAGGKIDRDAKGDPTGIVREGPATSLLFNIVPPPTPEQRRKALLLAINDALANGVTSVEDLSSWDDYFVLQDLRSKNQLHLRISEWLAYDTPLDTLFERRTPGVPGYTDPFLHTGMLKGYMDGSLGSRTAALAAPYSDDSKNSGIPRYDQDKLNAMAIERAEAGFQLGFHAIGDRANHMALEAFQLAINARSQQQKEATARAEANLGTRLMPKSDDPRFRIEHSQVLLPADFDTYSKLGIIASMQPSHLLTDMNWAGDRLGPDRAKYSYAWRSFLDHNVVLAFGTDYPVESINPFRGLYAAITRQNEAGTRTYEPQEKLTFNEALYAYTQGSAFADFREKEKGRLEPGFLADFIVLDRDITTATPQQLLHTRVLQTIVNGETVYTAPK